MYHLDLNDGRYDGDEPKWFKKEIRHSDPYVTKKNIVIIFATTSTPPIATKIKAIKQVITAELTGSSSFFLNLLSHLLADCIGIELSSAIACKVLGPTIIDPKADENVEAAKPSGTMILPNRDISPIIS